MVECALEGPTLKLGVSARGSIIVPPDGELGELGPNIGSTIVAPPCPGLLPGVQTGRHLEDKADSASSGISESVDITERRALHASSL